MARGAHRFISSDPLSLHPDSHGPLGTCSFYWGGPGPLCRPPRQPDVPARLIRRSCFGWRRPVPYLATLFSDVLIPLVYVFVQSFGCRRFPVVVGRDFACLEVRFGMSVLWFFGLCTELCVHCHSPVPEHSRQPNRNGTPRVVRPQTPLPLASGSLLSALCSRGSASSGRAWKVESHMCRFRVRPPRSTGCAPDPRVSPPGPALPSRGRRGSGESGPFCGSVCPRPGSRQSCGFPRDLPASLPRSGRMLAGGVIGVEKARLHEVRELGLALCRRGLF